MRIFAAAAEIVWQSFDRNPDIQALMNDPKYSLFYTYLHDKMSARAVRSYRDAFNVCDSGAHSFFTASDTALGVPSAKSKKDARMDNPDLYVVAYIKWMIKNWDHFDYFVELDIQDLIGYERVLRWRELYKQAKVWPKVMPCYHDCNSWDEFRAMVDDCESRYIGIEGVRSGRPRLDYNRFIQYCYENDCLIHGFALVKPDYLNAYPFFSVDSSSMNYMWRAQMAIRWDEKAKKIRQISGKQLDDGVRGKLFEHRIPPSEFVDIKKTTCIEKADVWMRRVQKALEALRKQEQHFTRLWSSRGIDWDEERILGRSNGKAR